MTPHQRPYFRRECFNSAYMAGGMAPLTEIALCAILLCEQRFTGIDMIESK